MPVCSGVLGYRSQMGQSVPTVLVKLYTSEVWQHAPMLGPEGRWYSACARSWLVSLFADWFSNPILCQG